MEDWIIRRVLLMKDLVDRRVLASRNEGFINRRVLLMED